MKAAAIIGLIALMTVGSWLNGRSFERSIWQESQWAAVESAIATERKRQEISDNAAQQQIDTVRAINADLVRDIDGLRNRPGRVRTVIHPGTTCTGGTGAELSREDAEFLVGEAARADTIRAGLTACYQYADGLVTERN